MAQLLAGAAGALVILAAVAGASAEMCGLKPTPSCGSDAPAVHDEHDYSAVIAPRRDLGIDFPDLPGFTRSTYHRDHALITPESRVWAGNPAWNKSLTAHLISPASGANFAMYLANLKEGGAAASPDPRVERFVFVLEGEVVVSVHEADGPDGDVALGANHYVYFPAGSASKLTSPDGAAVLVYERVYAAAKGGARLVHGFTEASPLLPVSGEVFRLRKLLPQTSEYDFNVHVMDFAPGEYLNVKEIHYNQHGLLLVEGQGIYRLADKWYPVQAGDAIWMAPYVIQWYAALGSQPSRYILYKDTTVDPLFS